MSTESNHDKTLGQDYSFDACNVVAVLEDKVIEQLFKLRARYLSPPSVLFRLCPVLDRTSAITAGCLQIEAGDVELLEKKVYGKANTNEPDPRCLEEVRKLLNGMQSVTCLRFQLRRRGNVNLIRPFDSDIHNTPDGPVPYTCASLKSLAAASLFSLYFRHDILPRKTFQKYAWAIGQFPSLQEAEKRQYQSMVDVRRLYHGAGGEVYRPHDDRCSPPAPGTSASCGSGSTVPFDEVPPRRGHQGSPPPYDEVGEEQSLRDGSDAASILATSPGGDSDLPEYGDTERRDSQLSPLQHALPCDNEASDIRPITKRKHPSTSPSPTNTCATDAPRHEKKKRFLFVKPDDNESQFPSSHQLQHQQTRLQGQQSEELQKTIDQLQTTVGELQKRVEVLQRWKEKHEEQCGELEGTCYQLAERQNDVDDTIGCLSLDVDELGGKHDELGKQMLDVGDEVKDLMEGMQRTATKRIRKLIDDIIADEIQGAVEAQIDQVKRKICKALKS